MSIIVDIEEVVNENQEFLKEYVNSFVQRVPGYAIKFSGRGWYREQKALADTPIENHLYGRYSVATLGKWYPSYAILDIDDHHGDRPNARKDVDRIRESLNVDTHG